MAQPEGAVMMRLTKDFKTTVQARVARDPSFQMELLREGVECLHAGDVKTTPRLHQRATIHFDELDASSTRHRNGAIDGWGNPDRTN